jgi:hypothetical protein
MLFVRDNAWHYDRVSSMNIPGEGKICWVCRIREIVPNWRPGMPIPAMDNPMQFTCPDAEGLRMDNFFLKD